MKLDPARVPAFLEPVLPMAELWGIPDDGLRGDAVCGASTQDLERLARCFDGVPDEPFEAWLTGPEARADPTDEYVAISALLCATDLAKLALAERTRARDRGDAVVERLLLSNGRTALIGAPGCPLSGLQAAFAALVPAFSPSERREIEGMVPDLLERGCAQLCCVGPEAELLHDAIDDLLEERGALAVVTTWHGDLADAREYFLYAVGELDLLALVARHPELKALLGAR